MKPVPAIVEPAAVDIDAAAEHILVALAGERDAARSARRHEEAGVAARETEKVRRLEAGRWLLKVRPTWPASGPKARGWSEFLARVGLDDSTAVRYMDAARISTVHGEPPRPSSPQDPAHERDLSRISDGPPLSPVPDPPDGDRDSYCTPEPITRCFPVVDFDPCSNRRSTVRSLRACWFVERGEDGLAIDWVGTGYWNVPYSKPLPWAKKFDRERAAITAAGWLVNTDQSTEWWSLLIRHLPIRLDFDERIQFTPPPGVKPSQNDRPQTLLMDEPFWAGCDQAGLLAMGKLWRRDDDNR